MFVVAERFLSDIVDKHGKYPISTDGDTWYPPQACRFLKLNHHIHSFVYKDEKSIIERTMQCIKNRTNECFDDFFPCRKKKCKLKHVINWLNLFVDYHNKELHLK
jgi:putative transposase